MFGAQKSIPSPEAYSTPKAFTYSLESLLRDYTHAPRGFHSNEDIASFHFTAGTVWMEEVQPSWVITTSQAACQEVTDSAVSRAQKLQ